MYHMIMSKTNKRRLKVVNDVDFDDPSLCQSCGACCGPSCAQMGWPDIAPSEVATMKKEDAEVLLTTEPGFLAFQVKMSKQGYFVCPFLKGRIGEAVRCSIYESRPQSCREFEAGSKACKDFRKLRADSLLAKD